MAEADSENAEDAIRGADKPDESPESKVEHEKDSKEADDVGMRDKEKEDVKADEQINSVENEEERESFDVGKGDADKRGETTKTVVDGALFFHFSIFLLWVLVACMSVPSVLTWAHNFK